MEFLNKFTGATGGDVEKNEQSQNTSNKDEQGGLMDKFNGMAGGGAQGEKNEDMLDKGEFL